jgi:flagellar biogenesis protein FliO
VRAVSPYAGYVVETFVTLAVVCALAVLLLWGAKRAGLGRGNGPVELCGHVQLEAKRAIYLVKVIDTVYVVGAGEAGLVKLGEMPASALPPLSAGPAQPFSDVLSRVLGKRSSPP